MPQFPTREWMDAFCAALAAHPQAEEVADALDGTYRFVVEPSGPLRERHAYDVAINPDGSGGPVVELVDDEDAPDLELVAGYHRWRQLLEGQLDIGMAVMLRRLRIHGDVGRLRSRLGSAAPLMDALRSVETQWPDG